MSYWDDLYMPCSYLEENPERSCNTPMKAIQELLESYSDAESRAYENTLLRPAGMPPCEQLSTRGRISQDYDRIFKHDNSTHEDQLPQ